jgi:hypothetical protein
MIDVGANVGWFSVNAAAAGARVAAFEGMHLYAMSYTHSSLVKHLTSSAAVTGLSTATRWALPHSLQQVGVCSTATQRPSCSCNPLMPVLTLCACCNLLQPWTRISPCCDAACVPTHGWHSALRCLAQVCLAVLQTATLPDCR